MFNIKKKYYEVIKKATGSLYQAFNGESVTHTELKESVNAILPIMLRNPAAKSMPEYNSILKCVIEMYEEEIGIKTYAPTIVSKDGQSTYWLHKIKPSINHSFFNRYKLHLVKAGFYQATIEEIENACEETLSYCANPKTSSLCEKKRGLVIGDVQAGKTANYLGLINMAYDYGYKIVVLLAGTTNSLRTQTQKRTDLGVIGAKSDTIGNCVEYIGVGFDRHEHYVVPFTNQQNDFKKFIQRNHNTAIGDLKKPVVLVVKKVKSVLESVSERLQSELNNQGLDSKSILIIDDEADNASPNTAKSKENATTINKAIRSIFNKFPIASYVGYTATPFANVFINPEDTEPENLDLFPADFIVQLHPANIYFGGRKVFPQNSDIDELPRCLRLVNESEENFLPVIHDKDISYPELSESLKEAIHSFLINNVVRTLRDQPTKHRSMMINITKFNNVQDKIYYRVCEYLKILKDAIEELSNKTTIKFIADKRLYNIHRLFTTSSFYKKIREGSKEYKTDPIEWIDIQHGLYDEIKQVQVVVINSKNGKIKQSNSKENNNKRFDYDDYEKEGARVIVIGGMVLSRGLTLEGLMTSYYSRNAIAYDTLLQMCRWFGYRPGYEDLCQVYLSQENVDRFDAVLEAVEDLTLQLDEMKRQKKAPKDFGLMIRESPETLETSLLITAYNKMRDTDVIQYRLNYGGVYADTSKLFQDPSINKHNFSCYEYFVKKLNFKKDGNHNYLLAQQVKKFDVAELVRELKIPYVNKKFDTEGLAEYIENSDVFPHWDVVIASGSSQIPMKVNGEEIHGVVRSFHIKDENDSYIRIGGINNRVMDPQIFNAGLGLTKNEKDVILAKKNKRSSTGKVYTDLSVTDYLEERTCPLLVIYPIELKINSSEAEKCAWGDRIGELEIIKNRVKDSLGKNMPLFAFAFGFPKKESSVPFVYRVNKVKLKELIGDIEINDEDEGIEEDDD